jgi:hypothetical protein
MGTNVPLTYPSSLLSCISQAVKEPRNPPEPGNGREWFSPGRNSGLSPEFINHNSGAIRMSGLGRKPARGQMLKHPLFSPLIYSLSPSFSQTFSSLFSKYVFPSFFQKFFLTVESLTSIKISLSSVSLMSISKTIYNFQCCGCTTFWCVLGSGSADPCL